VPGDVAVLQLDVFLGLPEQLVSVVVSAANRTSRDSDAQSELRRRPGNSNSRSPAKATPPSPPRRAVMDGAEEGLEVAAGQTAIPGAKVKVLVALPLAVTATEVGNAAQVGRGVPLPVTAQVIKTVPA
jgi:hypothetical protein